MTNKETNQDASTVFMDAFCAYMERNFVPCVAEQKSVAVAVSGGADSLALCFALSQYLEKRGEGVALHALSVDHGLRDEAAKEAAYVREVLKDLPNVTHHVLTWAHTQKPDARIQERARAARYELMADYMNARDIGYLFLGHHMDDQAETFLFRLAKGSGLDGLACMAPLQEMESGITLCRPMLSLEKADMVAYCAALNVEFIDDPSNCSDEFARVRLRKSMGVLSEEGITPKRLGRTAMRLSRARRALEWVSDSVYDSLPVIDTNRVEFNCEALMVNPDEVVLRVVLRAMDAVAPQKGFGARMERVERLCLELRSASDFRKQTLGGVVFAYDAKRDVLVLLPEV